MRILTTLFLLPSLGVAQVPVLTPRIGNTPDLSPERFAFFAWYNAAMRSDLELTAADQARFDSVYLSMGESFESPCEIIGIGCSWYCGGGPDSVRASSTLAPVGEHGYDALQAQDLDYCTAWCEGVQGPGIGESLTYHFAKDSPRLHTVMIANGLVTSDEARRPTTA